MQWSRHRMISCSLGLMAFAFGGTAGSASGEVYTVVKITDMKKATSYEVKTSADLRELQNQIQIETKLYPKAEELAVKEWKADEANKRTPFPSSRLSPRKVTKLLECASQDQADKKLAEFQDREMKKEDRDKQKSLDEAKKNPKLKQASEAKAKVEMEKEGTTDRAHEVLQAKLTELIGKAAGKKTDEEKAAEQPAKDAPKEQKAP